MILPRTDLDIAEIAAERIRRAVAETPLVLADGPLKLTLSGGCAADAAGDTDALLCRADIALYRAKAEGRDRIKAVPARSSLGRKVPRLRWLDFGD